MQIGLAFTIVVLIGSSGLATDGVARQIPPTQPRATLPGVADFLPGQRVKVEGRAADDGSFIAERISLRDPRGHAEIEGRVTAVDRARRSLRLLGFDVLLPEDVDLPEATTMAELSSGQRLEVRGRVHDGRFVAQRLRLRTPGPRHDRDFAIEAEIERVVDGGRGLALLGRRIRTSPLLVVRDQREEETSGVPPDRLRRDDGELRTKGIRIGDKIVVGGRFEASLRDRANFDLDQAGDDRDGRLESGGRVELSWKFDERMEVFAKSSLERDFTTMGHRGGGSTDLQVQEAYLLMRELGGAPVHLTVGRQRIRDSRGWFLDEYMDAARLHVDLSAWRFDAAVARALFPGREDDRARREALHVIASATRRLPRSTRVAAYFIQRHDRARDENPLWLGLMASGRVTRPWRYWSSLGIRRGHDDTTALRGWAAELGSTYRFDASGSPALTLRYAAGSGDRARQDGVDGSFRQTELQGNRGRFGGLRWFNYYGEAFAPELSNITIVTAAVGTRPMRSLSVDGIYHKYLRRSPDRPLSSFRPDADLVDGSPDLGQEIDAVLAWRAFGNIELSMTAGIFFPGAAFGPQATRAFIWQPRFRVYF